jgi:hypothetical protein
MDPSWALLEKFKSEWRVLKAAPYSLLVISLAISGLVWITLSWRYSAIIDGKDIEISILKTRIEHGPGGASTEAKNGRHLTSDQRDKIFATLQSATADDKRIVINTALNCECETFAQELRDVVHAAGWTPLGEATFWPTKYRGINILANDPKPKGAIIIAQALNSARMDFGWGAYVDGHVNSTPNIGLVVFVALAPDHSK